MEVKEAIEFVKVKKYNTYLLENCRAGTRAIENHNQNCDDIISLLQQGEKYRQLVRELIKNRKGE